MRERARRLRKPGSDDGVEDITGGAKLADGRGDPSVLYGGPEPLFLAHRETLAALGGGPVYVGADVGGPAAYDLALLDLFATAVNGLVHSFALARAEGIPPRALAGFAQGIGGLLPEMATRFADQLEAGRFPGDRSTIASARSGLQHIIEASDRHGLDTGVLRAVRAVTDRAAAAGHEQDGLARLTEFLTQREDHGTNR